MTCLLVHLTLQSDNPDALKFALSLKPNTNKLGTETRKDGILEDYSEVLKIWQDDPTWSTLSLASLAARGEKWKVTNYLAPVEVHKKEWQEFLAQAWTKNHQLPPGLNSLYLACSWEVATGVVVSASVIILTNHYNNIVNRKEHWGRRWSGGTHPYG